MPTPIIRFINVAKRFGTFLAVDCVSFSIEAGEFLTLLGPSGCGKTTVLRMISGFERPTSGDVLIDGQDVCDIPPNRRDVNQVFQSYALFPHLSVRRNIEFGLRMKRLPRHERNERVDHVLEMLALRDLDSRKPAQLSGGQRQRVALARAIVNQPKVLLLDEPLAALDAKLRRSVQIELKHLQRRLGITFVFVTHDQDEALTMSDRIAVMNAGRVEQLASAHEIYHQPATTFVAEFVGQNNLLRGKVVERVDGGSARLRIEALGELRLPCKASMGDEIEISIRPEHVRLGTLAAENSFSAVVADRIFRGDVTQLTLRVGSGASLIAVLQESRSAPLSIGSNVICSIQAQDIVIVERK